MNETQETNETKETKDIEETKEIKETKETEGTQETKGTSETQETNETQEDRKQRELRKRSETPCTKNTIANWEYRSGSTESYTCMHLYIYMCGLGNLWWPELWHAQHAVLAQAVG